MKYWAFISYSHKDTSTADWLHEKLETYRIPRELVGRPSREGEVPERIMPIFRDREELPTSSELGENLQKSLEQSRYLIVICSPAGAQSRWVEEEVRAFRKTKGRDHIIALVASGIPNATDRSDPANECFPHSLRFDVDDKNAPVRVEPIAADIRPEGDGRERAFLKIVAGLVGVGFDDLYQREKRRQTRRKILAGATIGAGLLLLGGIYLSIAGLGKSQTKLKNEMVDVQKDASVATTEYSSVRPKNKEAEQRIRSMAERASAALDALEQARTTRQPDNEYRIAYENAGKAIVDVLQSAKSADESIFAGEIAKPLNARMLLEGEEFGKEMTRRANEKIERAMQQMKRKK